MSPTELKIARGLFPDDTQPTLAEPPQKGSQETIGGVFEELQPESRVSTRPRSKESLGSFHTQEISPHLGQRLDSPLSQKRWKGIGYCLRKVLGFFGI